MAEKPASWKKLSAISQASALPGTMAVQMQRSYHLNDEDETEVDTVNVVKGWNHCQTFGSPKWFPLIIVLDTLELIFQSSPKIIGFP